MTDTVTVYVSIGNSDDKLTQDDWCHYCIAVKTLVQMTTPTIHGEWYSRGGAPWQNMAMCFEIPGALADAMKQELRIIAAEHCQDSIAWATAATEFLAPDPSVKPYAKPFCLRCRNRGYVPDWTNGLSAEHGEPGMKRCPDCQENT